MLTTEVQYGKLWLNQFTATLSGDYAGREVTKVTVNGIVTDRFKQDGNRVTVSFDQTELTAAETLKIDILCLSGSE